MRTSVDSSVFMDDVDWGDMGCDCCEFLVDYFPVEDNQMVGFYVYDKDNNLVDCLGPVETVEQIGSRHWLVSIGYFSYEVEIPEGGRYELT